MIALEPSATGAVALLLRRSARRACRRVAIIRNGVVAIDRVTIAPNRLAASGEISSAFCAWANRTKPNSPPWLSSSPRASAGRHAILNAIAEAHDHRRLDRDQRRGHADHEKGPLGDGVEIEHHADGEEEEAEQDRAERLDVGLELVPVGRVGEHHAGDERAQARSTGRASPSPRRWRSP